MTVQSPPMFNQTGSYPSVQLRQLIAALSPPGILKSTDLLVSALLTPNMSVNVAGGSAVIAGTEATTQGSYLFFNDATVNVPIAASDPTNPRNDLIVAVIRDAADYSGANNDSRLIAVTGTPAASPADPAVPNNAVVLARVRVDATVTTIVAGKVTDLRALRGSTAHLISAAPGPPTLGNFNTNLNAASFLAGATDTRGTMSLTPSAVAGIVAGQRVVDFTFATPYANPNYAVVLSRSNITTGELVFAATNKLTTGFSVSLPPSDVGMNANTPYLIDYIVIG